MSIAYHERLGDEGIDESTGSVADSYDNALTQSEHALAQTVNGLYKSELIYSQTWEGLRRSRMGNPMCWVHWRNTTRLHSELGYRTP